MRYLRRKLIVTCVVLLGIAFLGGCTPKENPEYTPWNTGYTAILETEDGYYYNIGYREYKGDDGSSIKSRESMMLRYYDKKTKSSIVLCAKPECDHTDPETCVAIYKNMTVLNTVLYDGSLYVYGAEEDGNIIKYSLYKIAADASSVDLVATIYETENTLDEKYYVGNDIGIRDEECAFIIHKGVAYLSGRLQIGQASKGFRFNNLVSVDLASGKVTPIYEGSTKQSGMACNLQVKGEYLYYTVKGSNNIGWPYHRYSLAEQKESPYPYVPDYVLTEEEKAELEKKYKKKIKDPEYQTFFYEVISEDRLISQNRYLKGEEVVAKDGSIYQGSSEEDTLMLLVSDIASGKAIYEESIDTGLLYEDSKYEAIEYRLLYYDEKVFVCSKDKVSVFDVNRENDTYGKCIAEIAFEAIEKLPGRFVMGEYISYKISDGKLYCVEKAMSAHREDNCSWTDYYIFSCPLVDVLAGTGKWLEEFTTKR